MPGLINLFSADLINPDGPFKFITFTFSVPLPLFASFPDHFDIVLIKYTW